MTVFLEMREVTFEARGRDGIVQARELGFVNGLAGGFPASQPGVGDEVAPLLIAIDRVLRREARQDAEGVERHIGVCGMEFAQISAERGNLPVCDGFLACGEQAAIEQLVDRQDSGFFARQRRHEPRADALGIAWLRVVIAKLAGRRHDVRTRELPRIDDELPAGRSAVERHEHDGIARCG